MAKIRILLSVLLLHYFNVSFSQWDRGLDNRVSAGDNYLYFSTNVFQDDCGNTVAVDDPIMVYENGIKSREGTNQDLEDNYVFHYGNKYYLPSTSKFAYYSYGSISIHECADGSSVHSNAPLSAFKRFEFRAMSVSRSSLFCEPKVAVNILAEFNDSYVGQFNINGTTVFRDYYKEPPLFLTSVCKDNGGYFTTGNFDYCRLASSGSPIGKIGLSHSTVSTTQTDLVNTNFNNTYNIQSDDGNESFDFLWINTEGYCYEILETLEYRLVSSKTFDSKGNEIVQTFDNSPWSGIVNDASNSLTYLGYNAFKVNHAENQYGSYEYEFRIKNKNIDATNPNSKFNFYYNFPNHITVKIEPACKSAADPIPSIVGENGASVVTIQGGYSTTPLGPNAIEGGYQITKAATYDLNLDGNSTIGTQQQNFGISPSCPYYNTPFQVLCPQVLLSTSFVSKFDAYYDVNYSTSNPPYGMTLQSNPDNGKFKFSSNQDLASYTFTVSKKALLHGLCKEYQPLNIFVGGGNLEVSRRCLVTIPDDLMDLFPGLIAKFGHKIVLSRFTFKIRSQVGIVIRPTSNNSNIAQTDEVVLADGAQLIAETTPETPSPELVDNTKNWTQSTIYNDQGSIIADQKQFLDSKGQPTQLQWKNLSAGIVLASENLYDAYGRLGIKTLPAPVSSKKTYANDVCGTKINRGQDLFFVYNRSFISRNGAPYASDSWDDYSLYNSSSSTPINITKKFNPDPVYDFNLGNTLGTLGWYYGNWNRSSAASNFVPDPLFLEPQVASTSYPYSRILYHEDGSNRVKGATLPGLPPSILNRYTQSDRSALTTADQAIVYAYLSTLKVDVQNGSVLVADMNTTAYKEIIIDSEGNETNIYKNIDDQVIITRHVPSGDLSYNFYNAKGQLVSSMTPLGVKQIRDGGIPYTDAMKTTFNYNHRGQLIRKIDPDEGTTWYMYSDDGKLRFTQNDKQTVLGKFNYVNYDRIGRPTESGEFTPSGLNQTTDLLFNTTQLKAVLNYASDNYDLSSGGDKSEVIKTTYDVAGPVTNAPAGKSQEFLMGAVSYTERGGGNTKTWYSYDDRGRVVWMATYYEALQATKVVEYTYTYSGQVKQIAYQPGTSEAFYHGYGYDFDNRLVEVRTSTDPITFNIDTERPTSGKTRSQYDYYLHGPLKRTTLGDISDASAATQKLDYRYTPQGWLKAINNPYDDASTNLDIFSMALDYFYQDFVKNEQPIYSAFVDATFQTSFKKEYYNGIVKSFIFKSVKPSGFANVGREGFVYSYDNKYQLLGTRYSSVSANVFTMSNLMHENFTYDANGNLLTLNRQNATTGAYHSNFTYSYDPAASKKNRVMGISGYASNYTYSDIGEVTARNTTTQGSETYTYDSRGLVSEMDIVPVSGTASAIEFTYDESGNRIEKEMTQGTVVNSTVYARGLGGRVMAIYQGTGVTNSDVAPVYSLSEMPIYGASRLGYINHLGDATFEVTDHLGNVRATFLEHKQNGVLTISDYAEYYAHGLEIPGRNQIGSPAYRNGYQGQFSEKDGETGLSYFQLRMWDRMAGRWLTTDPYGQFQSPYVGMGNNPITGVDPDGGWVKGKSFFWNLKNAFGGDGQTDRKKLGINKEQNAQTQVGLLYKNMKVGEWMEGEELSMLDKNAKYLIDKVIKISENEYKIELTNTAKFIVGFKANYSIVIEPARKLIGANKKPIGGFNIIYKGGLTLEFPDTKITEYFLNGNRGYFDIKGKTFRQFPMN